jgi:DNA-binding response OmpR family regulator/HPt (histidine-containing phosphotransfer) domain-containing protein
MEQNARKLLIIEDDPIIANIYRSKFEKEGYEAEIAADGQVGFYRLHEGQFDALLLDLMLPQMNGLEILRKIRAQKRFEKFPVIVFTNAYLGNIAHEAAQAGATHIFFKANTTPRQIIDTLNSILFLPSSADASSAPPPGPSNSFPVNRPTTLTAPSAPAGWTPPNQFPGPSPAAGPSPSPASAQPPPQSGTSGYPPMNPSPPSYPARPASAYPPPGAPSTPTTYQATNPAGPYPAGTGPAAASPMMSSGPLFSSAPQGVGTGREGDLAFQAEILRTFLETAPESINVLRKLLQTLTQSEADAVRVNHLLDLSRKIHSMTGNAGLAGLHAIPQIGAAFEALVKELCGAPGNLNASTIHTVAQTIDFLGVLIQKGTAADSGENRPTNILVVDDEVISRRAVTYALEKAHLKPISVEDPLMAYKILENNVFDLVITDVDMPGMTGFELCTKLRALPHNKSTPVIFVTGLTDFESRARSVLSGGNDLIAKPFMLIELALKALTFIIRGRIS